MSSYDKEYFKFVGRHGRYSKSVIAAHIYEIRGIRKIEVNYITNIMMVEFDATLIPKQNIRKRLLDSKCKFLNIGLKF